MELADALSVSRKTVQQWIRRNDWPASDQSPWTVAEVCEIRKWRASLKGSVSRASSSSGVPLEQNPERLAALRLVVTRSEILELDRGIKAGQYIRVDEVEAGRVSRIQAVKQMLLSQKQRVRRRLGGVLKNEKTITRIIKIVDDEARRILRTFAGQGSDDDE